jgi:hypothetical protein
MNGERENAVPEQLLSTRDAGAFLRVSPRTLEDWRLRGGGPLFRKLGRRLVRYRRADLEAFLADATRANTGQTTA